MAAPPHSQCPSLARCNYCLAFCHTHLLLFLIASPTHGHTSLEMTESCLLFSFQIDAEKVLPSFLHQKHQNSSYSPGQKTPNTCTKFSSIQDAHSSLCHIHFVHLTRWRRFCLSSSSQSLSAVTLKSYLGKSDQSSCNLVRIRVLCPNCDFKKHHSLC